MVFLQKIKKKGQLHLSTHLNCRFIRNFTSNEPWITSRRRSSPEKCDRSTNEKQTHKWLFFFLRMCTEAEMPSANHVWRGGGNDSISFKSGWTFWWVVGHCTKCHDSKRISVIHALGAYVSVNWRQCTKNCVANPLMSVSYTSFAWWKVFCGKGLNINLNCKKQNDLFCFEEKVRNEWQTVQFKII